MYLIIYLVIVIFVVNSLILMLKKYIIWHTDKVIELNMESVETIFFGICLSNGKQIIYIIYRVGMLINILLCL